MPEVLIRKVLINQGDIKGGVLAVGLKRRTSNVAAR
jgi:hypothetical protein